MIYRVKSGRPIEHRNDRDLAAVQCALRKRDGGYVLAMTFDPGYAPDATLGMHAMDIMLGLMFLRGWRHDWQEMRIGLAREWPDRWWAHPVGPHTFVVESNLAAAGTTDADDIESIASLAKVAWCMERELHLAERPIPDLMTAFAPGGIVLANIHPEPMRDAMRAQRDSIAERMATLPEPMRSATHAHVLLHLEGSTVRPWSLPGRTCAFGSSSDDPAIDRVFVALEDTSEAPLPETARTLLRLMLASGTDD